MDRRRVAGAAVGVESGLIVLPALFVRARLWLLGCPKPAACSSPAHAAAQVVLPETASECCYSIGADDADRTPSTEATNSDWHRLMCGC